MVVLVDTAMEKFRLARVLIVAIYIVIGAPVSGAVAQTSHLLEIIQKVMAPDGYLDQHLYDEFWSSMPAEIRDDPLHIKEFRVGFTESSKFGIDLRREILLSLKMTMAAKKVVRSPNFQKSIDSIVAYAKYPKEMIDGQLKTAEGMLRAAASGEPVKVPQTNQYLTSYAIDVELAGLDAGITRTQLLFDPSWKAKPQEFQYPDAHIAIVSILPFTRFTSTFSSPEDSFDIIGLFQSLDDQNRVALAWYPLETNVRDIDKVLLKMLGDVLNTAGSMPSENASFTEWQGRRAVKCAGFLEEGRIYSSVVVMDHAPEGIMVWLSISAGSQEESRNNLDLLSSRSRYIQ